MANSLRTMVLLMLLAFCQIALGGIVRQTTSNRLLENKIPNPSIDGDHYYPQVVLMPDESVVLQNSQGDYIDVLSNDQFTGYTLNLDPSTSFKILDQPSRGTATISGNEIIYRPDVDFAGWDSFTYSLCDFGTSIQGVQCYQAEVRVFVVAEIAGPNAQNDESSLTDAPNSIIIDVLDNDYDSDGPFANWESLVVIAQPSHGIATVTSDYKIEYKPIWSSSDRFVGVDTFYYQICDPIVPKCDHASVTVTISQVCTSCATCDDTTAAFEDHLQSIRKVFRTEVLSIV